MYKTLFALLMQAAFTNGRFQLGSGSRLLSVKYKKNVIMSQEKLLFQVYFQTHITRKPRHCPLQLTPAVLDCLRVSEILLERFLALSSLYSRWSLVHCYECSLHSAMENWSLLAHVTHIGSGVPAQEVHHRLKKAWYTVKYRAIYLMVMGWISNVWAWK